MVHHDVRSITASPRYKPSTKDLEMTLNDAPQAGVMAKSLLPVAHQRPSHWWHQVVLVAP